MEEKIIQIMPAEGWHAIHEEGGEKRIVQLICWALVENRDGVRSVEGMELADTGEADLSRDESSFQNYTFMMSD